MPAPPASKTAAGRFFEDFRLGQTICHPTPRTLTSGDASLYSALTGGRFAPQSAETFARAIGYPQSPVDDLLAFHVVFGKTVSDVSLNAVANLGYADCRFLKPVFSGDTLSAVSQVIGLKENSNRQSGVVHVRSQGFNQRGETVIDYVRWVMVRKRDPAAPAPETHVPKLPEAVGVANLGAACPPIDRAAFDERAQRLASSVRGLSRRRADRSCRRRHRRRGRASDGDPALSERGESAFQPVQRRAGALRTAAGLWRARHLARSRLEFQRPRQRLPYRGDQRRPACRAALRRRHCVRLERSHRDRGAASPRRRRRP